MKKKKSKKKAPSKSAATLRTDSLKINGILRTHLQQIAKKAGARNWKNYSLGVLHKAK